MPGPRMHSFGDLHPAWPRAASARLSDPYPKVAGLEDEGGKYGGFLHSIGTMAKCPSNPVLLRPMNRTSPSERVASCTVTGHGGTFATAGKAVVTGDCGGERSNYSAIQNARSSAALAPECSLWDLGATDTIPEGCPCSSRAFRSPWRCRIARPTAKAACGCGWFVQYPIRLPVLLIIKQRNVFEAGACLNRHARTE